MEVQSVIVGNCGATVDWLQSVFYNTCFGFRNMTAYLSDDRLLHMGKTQSEEDNTEHACLTNYTGSLT